MAVMSSLARLLLVCTFLHTRVFCRDPWSAVCLSVQLPIPGLSASLLCISTLFDPHLLSAGEETAEEADSEDHVVLPRISGYL